jgi:hypothetical protein
MLGGRFAFRLRDMDGFQHAEALDDEASPRTTDDFKHYSVAVDDDEEKLNQTNTQKKIKIK